MQKTDLRVKKKKLSATILLVRNSEAAIYSASCVSPSPELVKLPRTLTLQAFGSCYLRFLPRVFHRMIIVFCLICLYSLVNFVKSMVLLSPLLAAPLVPGIHPMTLSAPLTLLLVMCTDIDVGFGMVPSVFDALDPWRLIRFFYFAVCLMDVNDSAISLVRPTA